MAKDVYIDVDKFKKYGLLALEDTTSAPAGSFRIMQNCQVTDRGGVSPRPGTELLGTDNTTGGRVRGFYNFKKSFSANELLIKTFDDKVQVYSKSPVLDWFDLKTGYTTDKEFGFVSSLVNTSNQDYVIGCNRFDDYMSWTGEVTQLNGALVGGETSVVVDSVLTSEIFFSGTATANTATTIDITGTPWAASQWNGLYVHILAGALAGQVRLITATTTNQITFNTLGVGPGNVAFEIRRLAFPATGTIIYNSQTIAYTTIVDSTSFPVASAHAAADNTAVTIIPVTYPANPRGNRMANYLARITVGNVRSAIARNTGGALAGYSAAGSVFVSKQLNPFDFGYSATRVAGEGDIIGMPYGGGDVTDVQYFEDSFYTFKDAYIEEIKYSQDSNDFAVRNPLKAGVGSIGKTIKGTDDIYFITKDKKFTSIGRVKAKDIKPQTENIGFKIKRLLDIYDFTDIGRGKEIKDKIYIPCKSASTAANNDIMVIYSKENKSFEGIWDLPVFGIEEFNSKSYYAESNGANVWEMFKGLADVNGTQRLPIASDCVSHFMNLTASKANIQALHSLYFEGYIDAATCLTFKAFKDFETSSFLTFTFCGTETGLLNGTVTGAFLGQTPIALHPIGSISDPDNDGRSHFQFRVYFPFQYANYFSVGWESSGVDLNYEIIRYGLGLKEDPVMDANKIKTI